MALDLHKTARQIEAMAGQLRSGEELHQRRLDLALKTFANPLGGGLTAEGFRGRVQAAAQRKVTWLVGEPTASGSEETHLAAAFAAPQGLRGYTVIATDGSQVDVDRHGPAHCFVINIGGVRIRYGVSPEAELFTEPHLYSRPEELVFSDSEGGFREYAIEGPLLGMKRMAMEALELARRVEAVDPKEPTLALLDGSLVLWELSGERFPDFVRSEILDRGLLAALDSLRRLSRARHIAMGSYISLPRATEVVNLLRIAYCPHERLAIAGCDRICGKGGDGHKECNAVALGLMDRDLFEEVLEPGERSATFRSQSVIVQKEYQEHQIAFFYVHTGDEVARVEMPAWVADDPEAVHLLHAGVLDQCAKGPGYPVALQEAHERAVVTIGDRRAFWAIVQGTLESKGVAAGGSLKAKSKRMRAV